MDKRTSYEIYAKEICKECNNRLNEEDLCNIIRYNGGITKCENFERCITTKCDMCKKEKECFKEGKENE